MIAKPSEGRGQGVKSRERICGARVSISSWDARCALSSRCEEARYFLQSHCCLSAYQRFFGAARLGLHGNGAPDWRGLQNRDADRATPLRLRHSVLSLQRREPLGRAVTPASPDGPFRRRRESSPPGLEACRRSCTLDRRDSLLGTGQRDEKDRNRIRFLPGSAACPVPERSAASAPARAPRTRYMRATRQRPARRLAGSE